LWNHLDSDAEFWLCSRASRLAKSPGPSVAAQVRARIPRPTL
jgi:hypothetical protein